MKKMLMLASVPSMIGQFNMSNIEILQGLGYEVHVACNFKDRSVWTGEQVGEFQKELEGLHISYFQADISRNVGQLGMHIYAIRQIIRLCKENQYEFLHCHTPIGGVIGRIAGKKTKTKVIYTAHGFHFFRGAPWKNWLLFYPVEWVCSWMTDELITINKEDYKRAIRQFHAKKTEYIPGVGVDTKKIEHISIDAPKKRKELQLPEKSVILVSVGELNTNKNHEIVLKALSHIKNREHFYFIICGQGSQRERLEKMAAMWNVNLRLLGYRNDVIEILKASDLFLFPSKREGLGISALEAMACGLPIITSDIHGINDFSIAGETGLKADANDSNAFSKAIITLICQEGERKRMGNENLERVKKFDIRIVSDKMRKIYLEIGKNE